MLIYGPVSRRGDIIRAAVSPMPSSRAQSAATPRDSCAMNGKRDVYAILACLFVLVGEVLVDVTDSNRECSM